MEWLASGKRGLRAELAQLRAAFADRQLWLALALFALLLALVSQSPLDYRINVGHEEGYGSDLPMLAGFHDFERANNDTIDLRWTTEESTIRLPGLGPRALQVAIRLLPVNDDVAQHGPAAIDVVADGLPIGALVVRPRTGGTYYFQVPQAPPGSSDHTIILRSPTYVPKGDVRALGTPVDELHITSAGGPFLPPWRPSLAWIAAALLFWLALRRAGLGAPLAWRFVLVGIGLACIAALLDPPRFAFGSATVLIIGGLCWLLVELACASQPVLLFAGAVLTPCALVLHLLAQSDGLVFFGALASAVSLALVLAGWLRPALGRLYTQIAPPMPEFVRRSLLIICLLVFATHYGGKIYPLSMWGDIGFHSNRYLEVLKGNVLLLSRNRGVDFPYPPAFYLLLAPFSLTGLDRRILLQLGGALLDAISPLLVYTIAACISGAQAGPQVARRSLLAAGIYGFSAATLMTTWWNFSTHTFTQFAHLLLITALVVLWHRRGNLSGLLGRGLALLFVLQSFVYLGHFGFWINMSLLGGLGLLTLLVAHLRHRVPWRVGWQMLGIFIAAQLFAVLFFYSAYTGLFLAQLQATASGGLTGLAGRQAVDRAILWNTLWDAGLRVHFGLFPVPLALLGMILLWHHHKLTPAQRAFAMLGIGTFLIALLFAILPFASGSTLSTRWLMFSAWAIAISAARVAQRLVQSGRVGRWLVLAMGSYIIWVSAAMWLGALAWRIRPPEPF